MTETWKDIKGFEGKYQVSNLGRVKSLNYNNTNEERVLKLSNDKDGYEIVCLCDKKKVVKKVHRLVAEAFLPNTDNLNIINHLNGIKTDNKIGNHEWCTSRENNRHAIETGLRVVKRFKCIETGVIYSSAKEVMEEFDIKYHYGLYTLVNRGREIHGLHFKYA
jgi:hypothetical protein